MSKQLGHEQMKRAAFDKARPVWLDGLSETMNIQAGFRSVFMAAAGRHILRVTGATVYRIFLNGNFIGHGPARCGHGYYRVDEWELPVATGKNLVAIEVAGYNANAYAYLDQRSFVQAEVVSEEDILAATGASGFVAYRIRERVQKIQRYSYQRPFAEAYKLSGHSTDWCKTFSCRRTPASIEVQADRRLVPRGVPYPAFETRQPLAQTASGTIRVCKAPKLTWSRESDGRLKNFKAFPPGGSTLYPLHELQSFVSSVRSRKRKEYHGEDALELKQEAFRIVDFGCNLTGFIGLHVECDEPVDVYLTFDEMDTESGDVSLTRYHCCNVVKYSLKSGLFELETLEPYTLKFLKLVAVGGGCRISGLYLREYACPDAQLARFASSDPRLNELFEAARQTFRQNSVDIFMDCPGRERAGWLCDSFFTARAERDLCGNSHIERNFFENYLLPDRYPCLPKGMLPMCYPSDHTDGWFIPNWAMWFVIQLEEYFYRSGDRVLVDALKKKVYGLVDYFKPFLNSDGLLEKLEKWVFLEWSEANSFSQDVSYPSNMVYAGMLDAAGMLYSDDELLEQAKALRETICRQSFDGEFFVDNAIRGDDGVLRVTGNRTETCQYYAFFFEVASPKTHPMLWQTLLHDFGPERNMENVYPEIHPSNAFIGFFLRLDILSRYGEASLILDQLYKSYLPMAAATGTLWEHKDTTASCNHGFAGHVAHILFRDILGVHFDPVTRAVQFSPPDVDIEWCGGMIPVGNEWIEASWIREEGRASKKLCLPRGLRSI